MRLLHILAAAILVCVAYAPLAIAAPEPSIVRLWPADAPATQPFDATDKVDRTKNGDIHLSHVLHPSLVLFQPTASATTQPAKPRAAVIICPGGGYGIEAFGHEGKAVAEALNGHGVVGFVLRYRLPDGHAPADGALPVPQQDVFRAIQIVRSRAADWNIDPTHIGIMGFSAGGHLAATAATLYDRAPELGTLVDNDAISKASARPDFAVLVYPVITLDAARTNKGTRNSLIGTDADATLTDRYSAQLHVTPQTPPLFILQAEDDKTVPPVNALLMATAAAEKRVPCELVLLHAGGHGFGLGKPGTEAAEWFGDLVNWMRVHGLCSDASPRGS